MDDAKIVQLYFERNEQAIQETADKYGNYCISIAKNILGNNEDAEECVNDTYLNTWNSIPPHKPAVLSAYLGKIARESAIDTYRKKNTSKRRLSEYTLALDEISECVSGNESTESTVDAKLLGKEISRYLRSVSEEKRRIFVLRYYRCDSVRVIAEKTDMSQAKVKSILHRTRNGLKKHLAKEGFEL